ncbi:MAG: NADPH-dependent oxidoreductase [Curvibacter sp.]|nr:NADPH-dependent oxidoreductase [Curvibacter sp.]
MSTQSDPSDLSALLQTRYGQDPDLPHPLPAGPVPVLQQLLQHRSVRAYLPDALPEGTLELLVAAAQSAPTSSNQQAWSVLAVQDPARKARLSEWSRDQAHIRQAPLFLVWLADLSRLDRVSQRQGLPSEANRHLEQFLVAAIDASLAAQNAVVAAEALGLGTVYIGALRNRAPEVAAELKLPPRVFPLFGLVVGRADPAQPASVKPRLAQSVVLHHEQYADPAANHEVAAVSHYDGIIQAFQRSQGLPTQPWSEQAAQRVAGAHSLSGRDRLKSFVTGQGFELI